jgi:hypothetical protein
MTNYVKDYEKEFLARTKSREDLERINVMKTRLVAFRHLPRNDQMTLFLPKEVHFVQLPTQSYYAFQPKREDEVVEATKIWLEKYLHSTDVNDDNKDCETDDEDDSPPSKLERLTEFVAALPFCTPTIMGFHNSEDKTNTDWCYCPCGPHMKIWRTSCYLADIFDVFDGFPPSTKPCKGKKRTKQGFLDHLNDESKLCILHRIVLEYTTKLYSK